MMYEMICTWYDLDDLDDLYDLNYLDGIPDDTDDLDDLDDPDRDLPDASIYNTQEHFCRSLITFDAQALPGDAVKEVQAAGLRDAPTHCRNRSGKPGRRHLRRNGLRQDHAGALPTFCSVGFIVSKVMICRY